MLTYTLEKEKGSSLYTALYTHIREDIRSGKLPAGSRLPSKRSLSANLGVSVVTVETAYAQLIAEGYAYAKERSGIYVCAIGTAGQASPPVLPQQEQPPAEQQLLDLSGGRGGDLRLLEDRVPEEGVQGPSGRSPDDGAAHHAAAGRT